MKLKKTWSFEYKGIYCEVVNWNTETPLDGHPSGNWNGYITILEKQIPDRFNELLCKKRKSSWKSNPWAWDYHDLEDTFNMRGGVTFYEVLRDEFNGKKIAIKVGNDYMHLWDTNKLYHEEVIRQNLKGSVDSFIKQYPDYLVWNQKDGSYIKPGTTK